MLNEAQQFFSDMHDRLSIGDESLASVQLFEDENILLVLDEYTRSKRAKWSWTDDQVAKGNDVVKCMNNIRAFWPLGIRQVYYQVISSVLINQAHWHTHGNPENPMIKDVSGAIEKVLKWLRIDGKVPWESIQDNTRTLTTKSGCASAKQFIQDEINLLFKYYSRCVAQNQEYHIEVWIEKEGLLRIVEPIADRYCRRVLACKGYNSISFQQDFYDRTTEAMAKGLKPVILYLGDWDPSGCNMIYAAMQTLQDELDLDLSKVIVDRCGINPVHFSSLPENPDPVPIKETDTRAGRFMSAYGSTCYELDAFHPLELQRLVEKNIQRYTNMDAVACNLNIEKGEKAMLAELRKDAASYLTAKFDSLSESFIAM